MSGDFVDWLRTRGDQQLRALVLARPDLITPVPAHLAGLATRATSPSGLGRALDRLNRFELAVVETLAVLPDPASAEELRGPLTAALAPGPDAPGRGFTAEGGGPGAAASPDRPATSAPDRPCLDEAVLAEALDRLRTLALIYGPDDALRLAPGLREAVDGPAGLGPPVVDIFRHHPPEHLEYLIEDISRVAHDVAPDTSDGVPDGASDTASDTASAGPIVARGDRPYSDPIEAGGGRRPRAALGERLAALLGDPVVVQRLIDEVAPQARAALDELAWGPPAGRLPNARREVRVATARSPIEQLLARGLLSATGEETVTLPREVGVVLRGGRVHRDLSAVPPPLQGTARDQALADRTAAGQAFTFVRTVEDLCERWSVDPPGVLRTGGLAVRDLKRTAQLLDLPEWATALVVETAHASGLIAASGSVDGEWLPSPAYDSWRVKDTAARWTLLARTWLAMERVPGLVGERDDRDRLLGALHPDLRRGAAPEVRAATLEVLAAAPPGLAPTLDSLRERMAWQQPRRRGPFRDRLLEFTMREAEHLGLTGLGVPAGHGRALVTGGEADPTELLAPLLPEPVDHVLLQADLTAVAPGPLTGGLRRALALVAEVESTGGATVYRFTEASVRRALDAGQGTDELLALLGRHSATSVPQPLAYLITDVARRHGRIRVGTASAYVRCDDPAVLDEVMADRRAVPLRLRRLAPTVIASRHPRATLVDALRSMGYAPAAESIEGDVIVSRPDARRTETAPAARAASPSGGLDHEVVAAAVRALRAGDEAHLERRAATAAPENGPPRSPVSATINALQEAIRAGGRVWIGYLDSQGHSTSRILEPARVEGGYLTAYDETRAAVHRFALHRITGVADV